MIDSVVVLNNNMNNSPHISIVSPVYRGEKMVADRQFLG